MLYLAHFEFKEPLPDGSDGFGHFTYLVEADNERAASRRLKWSMRQIKRGGNIFSGISRLDLHELVEIDGLPEQGDLGKIQTYCATQPPSIHCTLPFAFDGCRVLRRKVERDGDAVPFVTFDAAE